jgi:hypothetical protein
MSMDNPGKIFVVASAAESDCPSFTSRPAANGPHSPSHDFDCRDRDHCAFIDRERSTSLFFNAVRLSTS